MYDMKSFEVEGLKVLFNSVKVLWEQSREEGEVRRVRRVENGMD